MSSKHFHRVRHRAGYSYPATRGQKIYTFIVLPLLILALIDVTVRLASVPNLMSTGNVTLASAAWAFGASFVRLFIAFVLALVVALPLALAIEHSETTERLLLPLFDIIQSVPILTFFPVIILFFIRLNFLNGAAIFVFFLTMVWSIVFNLIAGLKEIPGDIKDAARIFGLKNWDYLKKVTLPAIFPYLVTGSLLAWAQGWNITIVAEVLHTYIQNGTGALDLFGIGNLLVQAVSGGNNYAFLFSITVLVVGIGLMNFFIWQKLLRYAERFKFE